MLVLTRRVDEAIVIGGDIVVTILSIQGSQVRLGIDAPGSVQVDREEIRDRKLARAAQTSWNPDTLPTPVALPAKR